MFGGTGLCAAIRTHDSSILDAMLQLKLDVNCVASFSGDFYSYEDFLSQKPLHYAIRKAEECGSDMVRQLLDAGANVEIPNKWKTPLLQAICLSNLQVVELLVNKGSNINRPARQPLSRTPLQQACECGSSGVVELLLQRGAEVNAAPAVNRGATALQLAAIQGSARIVRLLLDNKAEVHAAPAVIHGRTVLEGAAEHGRLSVINMLLAEGVEGFTNEKIESAREYAEKEGHWGCEERLKVALVRCSGGSDQRWLGL